MKNSTENAAPEESVSGGEKVEMDGSTAREGGETSARRDFAAAVAPALMVGSGVMMVASGVVCLGAVVLGASGAAIAAVPVGITALVMGLAAGSLTGNGVLEDIVGEVGKNFRKGAQGFASRVGVLERKSNAHSLPDQEGAPLFGKMKVGSKLSERREADAKAAQAKESMAPSATPKPPVG